MTATLHTLKSGASAGTYYTNDPYRETHNRDDYYSQDGGGVWWSTGESIVRQDAPIDVASFRDLCAGRDPRSGASLVRGAGDTHRAGWDVTLTACKTFSILWANGGANQRAQLEAIHAAAVAEALDFLREEELVEVRLGAGGYIRETPADLIVARFNHYTTRAGDPNCHTHCVLMNVAGSADGKHRTLEPARLFDWQTVVGSAFRAAMAERLVKELGLALREAGRGQFEIRGIPDEVIEAFSKRSAEIEAAIGGDRASASGAQKEVAALATRGAKADLPTGRELEERWRDELAAFDIDPWAVSCEAARDADRHLAPDIDAERDLDPPEVAGDLPVARAASRLFRHENVVGRKDLLQAALNEASLKGIGISRVRAEIADLERQGDLVRLTVDERDARWTTPALAVCEAELLRAADRPDERNWFQETAMVAALAAAPHLSDEQRAAVKGVADRSGVSVLEAAAGTGKTTLAKALVDGASRSGLRVIGLAPSWVAADELAAATGIEAFAIAKWRHDARREHHAKLDDRTLLLVDEAGMAGTRELADVLVRAEAAGAKVMLTGDRRQLASVAGASALRAVVDVVDRHATLLNVRRQEVDWQRAASILMARGDIEAGVRAYVRHGLVELVSGPEAARDRVIRLWSEARDRHAGEVLMLTRRNQDAKLLNIAARVILREEGRVTGADLEVMTIDREKNRRSIPIAVGDRVRFGETLPRYGIRNGTRATIEDVARDDIGSVRLKVRLEDGRLIEDRLDAFARERRGRAPAPPRLSHAYAGTVYSAQGRTADAAIMYVASPSDARELYVGLTRHRRDATLVVERDRLESAVRTRARTTTLAISDAELEERLFAEARRYAEKANVVDFIEDRPAFVQTGIIAAITPGRPMDLSRAFRAGRALRSAMQEIGAASRGVIRRLSRAVSGLDRLVPDRVQMTIAACRAQVGRVGLNNSPPYQAPHAEQRAPDLSW